MDDSGRMAAFISTVCSLGRQYKLDRDPQAASRAGQWLKAWFIAPATRMQPHLKYAQFAPETGRKEAEEASSTFTAFPNSWKL
ncbi:alginate lyase family protein [Akkermansia muciniphila]|nr:alginate lyase family protein [Akkermansia muciniphila]